MCWPQTMTQRADDIEMQADAGQVGCPEQGHAWLGVCRPFRRCSFRWGHVKEETLCVSFNRCHCSSLPVTQLQVTLASVQELLIQQQQKVQELANELATAKVLALTPVPRGALTGSSLESFLPTRRFPWGLTWSFLPLTARWLSFCRLAPPREGGGQHSARGLLWAHMPTSEAGGVDTEQSPLACLVTGHSCQDALGQALRWGPGS